MRPIQDDSSDRLSLPHTYRLHRRAALRLMGVGGLSLLAACSSKGSTDKGTTTSTTSSSGGTTATSAATTATSASSPASSSPAATTAATATQTSTAKQGGKVAIAVDQEPPTLDPHASPSAITFTMTASASESLLYLTDKRELVPWLAASYESAPDGKSVTFKLNKDVTFQDDTPFNADAVKWNLDRIVDPNFKAGGGAQLPVGIYRNRRRGRHDRQGQFRFAVRAVPQLCRRPLPRLSLTRRDEETG